MSDAVDDTTQILKLDVSLYDSKARGRNCVTQSNSHGTCLKALEPKDRLQSQQRRVQ